MTNPNRQPGLIQRYREELQARHYARRTVKTYERLDQAALLSARVQLDPSLANRERLRIFLELRGRRGPGESEDG